MVLVYLVGGRGRRKIGEVRIRIIYKAPQAIEAFNIVVACILVKPF